MNKQDDPNTTIPDDGDFPEFLTKWPGFMLSVVYEIAAQHHNAALAPLEIDGRHMAIFETLAHLGPQVQSHLSQIVRVDKATMVSLLNDLQKRGLVERRPHPTDSRANQIHLTDAGRAMMKDAIARSQQATADLFSALDDDEQQHFNDYLKRIAQSNRSSNFQFT